MTVGTGASQTVAAVANALNLPGIPFEVAERATDKIKMRRWLNKKGVAVPQFRAVWTIGDLREAVAEMLLFLWLSSLATTWERVALKASYASFSSRNNPIFTLQKFT